MNAPTRFLVLLLFLGLGAAGRSADRVVYEGKEGPGKGRHIVLLSGDEEYRSEEGLPMLARILAVRHGFKCTVLFPINPADGTIDPNNQTNVVGMESLKTADLVILQFRFRELPDDQMKYFVDYLNAGGPVIAIRTATHSFAYSRNKSSPYARYDWQSRDWPGGFGQQVLGETWVSHHGNHGKESTRAQINPDLKDHPVLKGVRDIWGPTDVYGVAHLPADARVLAFGEVLEGMKPGDPPVAGAKNHPPMPLIWVRQHAWPSGRSSRVLCSTIGAAVDLENEGLRRVFVNAVFWGLGMEDRIPPAANVDFVGEYHPTYFGFGKFQRGMKPSDFEDALPIPPRQGVIPAGADAKPKP